MIDSTNIPAYRVLIIDDDAAHAEMVSEFLRLSGFPDIDRAGNIHGLWECLKQVRYDIILLDYKLPDGTGLEVLDQIASRGYSAPVVMITGQGNERIAVQAIQRGAEDYLLKGGDYLVTLPAVIHKAINAFQLKLSVQRSLEQIRYQATLLNNVRDAVVVWDLSGAITFWNPAAASLFGWSSDERLDLPVEQVYLSAFTPPVKIPKEGDASGQHVFRKYVARDGKTIWVSSHVTALKDSGQDNRIIGYMDVSYDITRRVDAELALRDSEARYRAIVEDYQTELICRIKPSGVLTFVNEVFCRFYAKSRPELLGKNFLYFVPEAERARLVQHLTSLGPQKMVATLEHQVNIPTKGIRWLLRTDRAILDAQGRVVEFQSMGRDITEQKKLESQIRAAQSHLVQAARLATIGEMASGVAHQIFNPLTTIIADAQILLRSMPSGQSGRDSAEAIEQAGWRLQQVVQRLLEFSRPATEEMISLSVNDTIHQATSLVLAHIETIGCRLELQLEENLPPVMGNSRQLENLWVNLLLLARDACTNGGNQVAEHSHLIQVCSRAGPTTHVDSTRLVIVEIMDTGKYIPVEQLDMIFEPNFIGPTSGRGSGMELSICREIVRQHGGQITADSQPGHETIFRITFPAEV
jgi:PAS domain S-box-containing protein